MSRVVITGMGVISPLGNTCEEFFKKLAAGESGIRKLSADFTSRLSVQIAAEVDFDCSSLKKDFRTADRASQFAQAAVAQAWHDAAPDLAASEQRRAGVYWGTGMGGAHTLEESYEQLFLENVKRLHPLTIVMSMNNAAASAISIERGLQGPCVTYSVGCSSSAIAIGEAFRLIKHGYADVMLAGGSESLLTYGNMMCWESIGTLADEDADPSKSCKPFDKARTGFVLGEGAAALVLESLERATKRGARIYGEILGYSCTAEARHMTKPSIEGQAYAMEAAMADACISPSQVDYINAHGTATKLNDVVETDAIKKAFGKRAAIIPVSSTKSMHGHLMGAAGAVELVATVMALERKTIPPTATLRTPDPECDLDYVPQNARTGVELEIVMSNSFAFGGSNAVLIIQKYA